MSCSMDKVLADARALVDRLKEHDSAAESLIEQTSALNKRVEAMKQYQEEVIELNEVARHRPRSALVLGIQQENRQIRELQQENKELRVALEEHQSALELIMGKYREQMVSLLSSNKTEENKVVLTLKEIHCKELQAQVEKVCEMAAVMKKAINADDAEVIREQEKMAQLELENKTLRDLLKISKESFMSVVEEAKLAGKAGD
ncbi:FGFR1 oncogene partner 2 [Lethenteron reissneri]|uniref:IKB kinase n=1 Tax=Lethenteron camtschaticum TaxID=980415 RepID=A0A8A4ZNQ5_LETCA|nr:FGFR1 oncogene partner 2 [Lethenteron reissneri]XP_061415899.1 FGFR1 oncogene partner 2 [Lethenteron reissneri]XP_061415900.1 FGFR1 oncogene partner 2 [Lethenteron reissneri]XP_061415901.1 FGFR1 oncogene partner 2 [Lethenteron reissneri]QTE33772.1 IKB kinase [Lethenteron camtschaticum]